MYKITKTVDNVETINLVFDYREQAREVFNDLKYDEFVVFKKLYENTFNKETREETVNGELVYSEYKLSVPTFYITITLKHTEN